MGKKHLNESDSSFESLTNFMNEQTSYLNSETAEIQIENIERYSLFISKVRI